MKLIQSVHVWVGLNKTLAKSPLVRKLGSAIQVAARDLKWLLQGVNIKKIKTHKN